MTTIEHVIQYNVPLQPKNSKYFMGKNIRGPLTVQLSFEQIDFELLPALIEKTKKSGVWNCPTLTIGQKLSILELNFQLIIDV